MSEKPLGVEAAVRQAKVLDDDRMSLKDPSDGEPDVSPEDANLRAAPEGSDNFCGHCLYFNQGDSFDQPGSCVIVTGEIDPLAVCDFYLPLPNAEDRSDLPTPPARAGGESMSTVDGIDFKPTETMAAEAQRGLDWRKKFNRGGTEVGIARGRDISNRRNLSVDTVKRMNSYFARHEVDKKGKGWSPGEDGYPSNGRIAWALWGGDPGRSWASARLRQIEARERSGAVGGVVVFASDQPDYSYGIMACVRPNGPERFAIEGGTPVGDLHVTLAYFGSVEDQEWTESAHEQIAEVMSAEIARGFAPVSGEITAVTTFDLAGEEAPPLVLLVDAPGLGQMRDALVRGVEVALGENQGVKKNHDFLAHITLCYGATDEEMAFAKGLVGEKVRFDSIELVWGQEGSVWDFEGEPHGAIPDPGARHGLRFSDTFTEFGPEEGDSMPYEIVQDHSECDGYAVVKSEDNELMGCHDTEEGAVGQIAALHAAEATAGVDPLAIVIADQLTTEERLSAVEDFLAAQEGEPGGGGGVVGAVVFGAVAPHETPTTDAVWDGSANEARARSGEDEAYYRQIFAYQDEEGNPEAKSSWRFIHHEVGASGEPGAASLRACTTGIGVLNGARGGTTIPDSEKEGVYRHLASHLRDADMEAPELMGTNPEELADTLEQMADEAAASFKALPSHSTPTVNPPTFEGWNGSEVRRNTRSGETEAYYAKIFAWRDSQANPGNKTSYKFPHHNVSASGVPGAAVMWAVHAAIAVIDDSTIPTSDYQGVYNHLARHLRDGGIEDIPVVGEDNASIDEVRAAIAHVRGKYLAMVEAAAMKAADISGADDTALVGEVVRRWFESVAASKGTEAASGDDEFAADEASTDCPCHKGVLEDGATHTEGCPFAQHEEDEMVASTVTFEIIEDSEECSEETDGESTVALVDPETGERLGCYESVADAEAAWEKMMEDEMSDKAEEAQVIGDFQKGDFEWEGVLIVEGLPSGDGRMIEEGALTWRDLPIPLMLQTVNAGGHDGAIIAGSIHEIERQGHEIIGRGHFDSGADGQEAKRLLTEGTMRGVSADIDSVVAELRDGSGNDVAVGDVFENPDTVMEVLVEGRIMGATMTPFPAFQEAKLQVIKGGEIADDVVLVASGATPKEVWRFTSPYPLVGRGGEPFSVDHGLVASASVAAVTEAPVIPVHPPLSWFAAEDPDLDPAQAFKVYPNGRIYGLVAEWGTCHIGYGDRCVPVPRPHDGYATFRCGHVLTAEGTMVATGPIYADTVHPNLKMNASDTQAFYAHTGCALGDVVLYEGEFGILAAGAVKSDVSPEAVNRLRAAGVSPDWRNIRRNLEIVGLLSVNVSGFPVSTATALAASAGDGEASTRGIVPIGGGTPRYRWNPEDEQFDSLVAAGSMVPCTNCGNATMDDSAVLAILELISEQSAQINDLAKVIRPYRVEQVAAKMAELGFGVEARGHVEA